MRKLKRDPPEQLPLVEPVDLAGRRVEQEILVGRRRQGLGPIDVPGNVDAERQSFNSGGRFLRIRRSRTSSSLNTLASSLWPGAKKTIRSQAIFQCSFRARKSRQRSPRARSRGSLERCQSATRTSSDHSVKCRYSSRCSSGLPGKRSALLSMNSSWRRQVDGPHGAVIIDRAEQVAAHGDEALQGREAALVDRQPAVGEHAVAQQPVEIEGPLAVARHVGVAEHEVHVVDRVQPAEQAAEEAEPLRAVAGRGAAGPHDEEADLLRDRAFAVGHPAIGVAADAADQSRPTRSRMMWLPTIS